MMSPFFSFGTTCFFLPLLAQKVPCPCSVPIASTAAVIELPPLLFLFTVYSIPVDATTYCTCIWEALQVRALSRWG